jgi:hypothetical protein
LRPLSLEGDDPIGICTCALQLSAISITSNVPNTHFMKIPSTAYWGDIVSLVKWMPMSRRSLSSM